MRSLCSVSICAALSFLTSTMVLSAHRRGAEAEYMGGSVKSIPVQAKGVLDLRGTTGLAFRYAKSAYSLPYDHIKDFEFTSAHQTLRIWKGIPLPSVPWDRTASLLNISFRDQQDRVGVLSFRLDNREVSLAKWALSQHVDSVKDAEAPGRLKLPEVWWGDQYWKTNRNKSAWQDSDASAEGTAIAGTK